MLPSCLYHPTKGVRVFTDENERDEALESGFWFNNPTDAENMRADYENAQIKQLRNQDDKLSSSKQAKSATGRRQLVRKEESSDADVHGWKSSEAGPSDEKN